MEHYFENWMKLLGTITLSLLAMLDPTVEYPDGMKGTLLITERLSLNSFQSAN
jgi:hypothetical protein